MNRLHATPRRIFQYPASVPVLAGPCACPPAAYDALKDALNQVFRPEGGDLTRESPLLFDPARLENLRVITADDQPVAHVGVCLREALVWARRIRVACFGGVFTLPAFRGAGLASRLLADAVAWASARADLLMISGERELYRRQGFDPVPPGTRFAWSDPPTGSASVGEWSLALAGPSDVEELSTLQAREAVRFVRTPVDWQHLLASGQLMGGPGEVWLVRRAGQAVAYLAVQSGGRRPDGSPRPARVLEVAGDPSALVATAATRAQELIVPHYAAAPFLAAYETRGIRPTTRQFLISAQALTADVPVVPWLGLDYV